MAGEGRVKEGWSVTSASPFQQSCPSVSKNCLLGPVDVAQFLFLFYFFFLYMNPRPLFPPSSAQQSLSVICNMLFRVLPITTTSLHQMALWTLRAGGRQGQRRRRRAAAAAAVRLMKLRNSCTTTTSLEARNGINTTTSTEQGKGMEGEVIFFFARRRR